MTPQDNQTNKLLSQEDPIDSWEVDNILDELVPITEPIDFNFLTPELLYWLNSEISTSDWLKFQVQDNYKKIFDILIIEQKARWEKENLVDNHILPLALEYIHKNCEHPDVIGYQKYTKTRKEMLKDLFKHGTYGEVDNAMIKRVINLDNWTHEKDAASSKSWWRDVMVWLNLPYLNNPRNKF